MKWKPVPPIPGGFTDVFQCGGENCGALVRADRKEGHDSEFHGRTVVWEVQTGKGKGAYKVLYSFPSGNAIHNSQAWLYYSSINTNTQAGYKKRLVRRHVATGETITIARCI